MGENAGLEPQTSSRAKMGEEGLRYTAELCSAVDDIENRNHTKCMSCGVACVALKDLKKIDGAAVMTIDIF